MATIEQLRARLCDGLTIPACPLALNAQRKLDERRQRALFRYYIAAGSGGLAVGVHTTQFAIRDPKIGLFRPVLELASEEMARAETVATALGAHRRCLRWHEASCGRGDARSRTRLSRRPAQPRRAQERQRR